MKKVLSGYVASEYAQGKNFKTFECYTGLEKLTVPQNSTVLLECMSNLVANEMYSPNGRKNIRQTGF